MLRVCLLWSLRYRLLRTLRLRISLYRCLCVYRLLGVWLLLLYRRFRLCLLFHQVEEASPVHFRVGCLYLLLDFLQLAVEKVTLSTTGKAIEFAVSGGVVDGEDGVVNEPMQWVVTVYKNGKEIEKKSLVFRDGKEIGMDDLNLYYN